MHALTLHQPWAHAIAVLGKDVENRGWVPPMHAIGKRIAIHAGKTVRRDDIALLRRNGYELPAELTVGAVVATAELVGWVTKSSRSPGLEPDAAKRARRSPWFDGPVGWVFANVRPLARPLHTPGSQGLWRLPEALSALV